MEPKDIIVNIRLPNQRAYDVAWAVARLKGYRDLDECINDWVLEMLEMYIEGRAGFDSSEIDWGFKSRDQMKERTLTK